MIDYSAFQKLAPPDLANALTKQNVMDYGIHPLWPNMPRVAGPAYTVRCPAGENLMLHAAIHRAEPGSIIVVQAGDLDYALAGGNVCATAQKNGIAAFVIDGVIRDLAEIRATQFPVFARGISPIPGVKKQVDILNTAPVTCGSAIVHPGDIVVADEEGIVVIPLAQKDEVLAKAQAHAQKEATQTLDEWQKAHRQRIDEILREQGFGD